MAQNDMAYAEASNVLEAIRVLEGLERTGQITPAEQKALDRARSSRKTAEQAQVETAATYGGARAGLTANLYDEARGAYNAANEFLRSGDVEKAKQAYAEYRDLQRQIDEALQVVAPEQYAAGRSAGAIAGTVAPAGAMTKLAQGMSTLGRAGAGAVGGATLSALPEFGAGEGGFTERVGEISPVGTAIGAGVGGLAPVAGQVAGSAARGIQNLARGGTGQFSGGALRRVGKSLQRPQAGGQDIEAYLQSLGPEGMIADIPGSPRSVAQGLATMQGEGADVLRQRLESRSAGAGQRVEDVMTERFGPAEAAYAERLAQQERKSSELGPMYDAATKSDISFDVDDLRAEIAGQAGEAATNVRSALNTVLRDLGKEGEVSALKLHNARSALSDAANSARIAGQGNKARELSIALEKLDARLDTIPEYATARAGYAESSAIQRAVDEGRKAFSGGVTSALPVKDLQDMLSKMKPVEREAYKKGAREYIAALMGTSRNEASAAWAAFDKGFNREKLNVLLGEPDANAVIQRLFAEKEFSGTRGDVLAGSQTAFREEARESLADIREPDSGNRPGAIKRTYRALFDEPLNRMIDEVLYGSRRSNLNRQIGELLTMQGAERDKIVPVLLDEARRLEDKTRAQQIIDALATTGVMTYGAVGDE